MKILGLIITLSMILGIFGPPTRWPDNIDQLYQFIDQGEPGYVITTPCPADPGPALTFREAANIHPADEDALFYAGIVAVLRGQLLICKPDGDKALFYGSAIPNLLFMALGGED